MGKLSIVPGALMVWVWIATVRADWKKVDPDKLPPAAKGKMDFVTDIKPILERRCLSCHRPAPDRPDPKKTRFNLHSREAFLKGGRHGAPLVVGKSAASLMIHLISGPNSNMPQMPPPPNIPGRVPRHEIGKLRAWIDQGAPWPPDVVLSLPKKK